MDYAIEILKIELYKWQAVYNENQLMFAKEANQGSDAAIGISKEKIESLEKAILALNNKE